MYECGTCGYTTKRSFNFDLHTNRKIPCKPKVAIISKSFEPNKGSKNEPICSVIEPFESFKTNDNLACNKCLKTYSNNSSLKRHFKNCIGSNPLECQNCFKIFKTSIARCQHNRLVNCKRPVNAP